MALGFLLWPDGNELRPLQPVFTVSANQQKLGEVLSNDGTNHNKHTVKWRDGAWMSSHTLGLALAIHKIQLNMFLEKILICIPLECFLNWHLHLSECREILSFSMFTFMLFFLYYKNNIGVRWHTPMEITLNGCIFTSTPIYLSDYFSPELSKVSTHTFPKLKSILTRRKKISSRSSDFTVIIDSCRTVYNNAI